MNSSQGATAEQARRELDALDALSERAAIKLYSLVQDYLEQLRHELPHQLLQAVFHLCTKLQPEAFNAMAEGQRQVMRDRLLHLTQRCSSLLTVEQLAQLGSRLLSADDLADADSEEPPSDAGAEPLEALLSQTLELGCNSALSRLRCWATSIQPSSAQRSRLNPPAWWIRRPLLTHWITSRP